MRRQRHLPRVVAVASLLILGAGTTLIANAAPVASASSGVRLIYTHRVIGGPLVPASLPRSGAHFAIVDPRWVGSRRTPAKGVAPSITTQPTSVTVKAGTKVSFKAAAGGSPAPVIQWKDSSNGKKWSVIAGAKAASYSFIAAAAKNGYSYEALFANSVGSVTTKVVKLKVLFAPRISEQPSDAVAQVGSAVTFTAGASGDPEPSVHWEESAHGSSWTEIAGATSSVYSFGAVESQDGYEFKAFFKNAEGKATTHIVTLTVTPAAVAPVVASQAVAPTVTAQPAPTTVSAGSTASFTASASGSPAPTVQWEVSTDGATWTEITGATNTSYALVAPFGDSGYRFQAVFTNSAGSATSDPATLTVNQALGGPVMVTQPSPETVASGSTASFTASASGSPAPTVQWQQSTNGITWVAMSGDTSVPLVFTASVGEDGDQYRAVFSNTAGSVTSNAATLTVTAPSQTPSITSQPSNDAVDAGDAASFTAAASGTPTPTVQWLVSVNGGQSWTTISGATSTTYEFTSSASQEADEYEATFSNGVGNATSNPATLSVVVQPTSASMNWSGYDDTGSTFTGISASWTVPSVTCSGTSTLYSSQWIGIDGDGSATVEQDGTEADCLGGEPSYDAWYEMYGDSAENGGSEIELGNPVYPGDVISASVTVNDNAWTLSLTDSSSVSAGWVYSTVIDFTAQQLSAEWIVERPEICSPTCALTSLAEFQPVTFTNAQVTGGSGTGGIGMYSPDDVEMVNSSDTGILAIATALDTAGTLFSDLWQGSS